MSRRIEVLFEKSRAYAAARSRAMDRSTWNVTFIEALAMACAVAVFVASTLDAPPGMTAHVDPPVLHVSPAP